MKGIYAVFEQRETLFYYKELTTTRDKYGRLLFSSPFPDGTWATQRYKFGIRLANAYKCHTILYFNEREIIWNVIDHCDWYFKDARDATFIVLFYLRTQLGKDVSKLIAREIWKTRNNLVWG